LRLTQNERPPALVAECACQGNPDSVVRERMKKAAFKRAMNERGTVPARGALGRFRNNGDEHKNTADL
jgi:hypothetical protein